MNIWNEYMLDPRLHCCACAHLLNELVSSEGQFEALKEEIRRSGEDDEEGEISSYSLMIETKKNRYKEFYYPASVGIWRAIRFIQAFLRTPDCWNSRLAHERAIKTHAEFLDVCSSHPLYGVADQDIEVGTYQELLGCGLAVTEETLETLCKSRNTPVPRVRLDYAGYEWIPSDNEYEQVMRMLVRTYDRLPRKPYDSHELQPKVLSPSYLLSEEMISVVGEYGDHVLHSVHNDRKAALERKSGIWNVYTGLLTVCAPGIAPGRTAADCAIPIEKFAPAHGQNELNQKRWIQAERESFTNLLRSVREAKIAGTLEITTDLGGIQWVRIEAFLRFSHEHGFLNDKELIWYLEQMQPEIAQTCGSRNGKDGKSNVIDRGSDGVSEVDYERWVRLRPHWTVSEAAQLVMAQEPKGLEDYDDRKLSDLLGHFHDKILDALKMEAFDFSFNHDGLEIFAPLEFLKWCLAEKIPLPKPLEEIVSSDLSRDVAVPLSTESQMRAELDDTKTKKETEKEEDVRSKEEPLPNTQHRILHILKPDNRTKYNMTRDEIVMELGIVRSTFNTHVKPLRESGVIKNKRGVGYYLSDDPPPSPHSSDPVDAVDNARTELGLNSD